MRAGCHKAWLPAPRCGTDPAVHHPESSPALPKHEAQAWRARSQKLALASRFLVWPEIAPCIVVVLGARRQRKPRDAPSSRVGEDAVAGVPMRSGASWLDGAEVGRCSIDSSRTCRWAPSSSAWGSMGSAGPWHSAPSIPNESWDLPARTRAAHPLRSFFCSFLEKARKPVSLFPFLFFRQDFLAEFPKGPHKPVSLLLFLLSRASHHRPSPARCCAR